MKKYTFSPILTSHSGTFEFQFNLIHALISLKPGSLWVSCLLLISITVPAFSQGVTNPCSCGSYVTVGRTNETYSIGSIGFSLTSASCYLVKGNMVIDQPTYWNGLKLKMEEKAQIIVESLLSINNSYLSGCGDMWKGIRASDSEANIFLYSSTIEDAEFGVKISGQPGFVSLYNRFINDYVGIVIGTEPYDPDEFDHQIHRCQIWGNEFFTNTEVPDPYPGMYYYPSWPTTPAEIPYNQGFAAIFISGVNGAHIGYVGAIGADRNEVYQMRNGIIIRNSVSNVSGTDFYNFEGLIPNSIEEPVLDISQNAINMYRAVTRVQDNTMENLLVGIFALESNNTIFKNY